MSKHNKRKRKQCGCKPLRCHIRNWQRDYRLPHCPCECHTGENKQVLK